jgi:hypothetical protein
MQDKPQKSKPKLPNLGQLVKSLKSRIEQLERDVRAIRDIVNTKDNWHAETRDWIGESVVIRTQSGVESGGRLIWIDRYNVCIDFTPTNKFLGASRVVIPKGGIDFIAKAVK